MSDDSDNILQVPELDPGDCIFCRPRQHEILDENELGMILHDNYPVVDNHCLIVPRRHAPTCFDLNADEWQAMHALLGRARARLMGLDPTISGFNFGANAGPSAGQSVFHCHFHLFPRRAGDQENPRGGVRRIFPDKALYERCPRAPESRREG